MMRAWIGAIAGLGLSVAWVSAAGAESGANRAMLERALNASAKGECPADIMGPTLRGACLQQMPSLGQRLAALGPITKADFMGVQQMPAGPQVEVYRVIHANGSMLWSINVGSDGKIQALFSPG